mmetsp:Transcript_116047/g.339311  ORF Transcript_116047/g.339311 Transcript_116047/m.339311 type:complete len:335 (-) Transcript_116047:202-1206(-)
MAKAAMTKRPAGKPEDVGSKRRSSYHLTIAERAAREAAIAAGLPPPKKSRQSNERWEIQEGMPVDVPTSAASEASAASMPMKRASGKHKPGSRSRLALERKRGNPGPPKKRTSGRHKTAAEKAAEAAAAANKKRPIGRPKGSLKATIPAKPAEMPPPKKKRASGRRKTAAEKAAMAVAMAATKAAGKGPPAKRKRASGRRKTAAEKAAMAAAMAAADGPPPMKRRSGLRKPAAEREAAAALKAASAIPQNPRGNGSAADAAVLPLVRALLKPKTLSVQALAEARMAAAKAGAVGSPPSAAPPAEAPPPAVVLLIPASSTLVQSVQSSINDQIGQ